MLETPVLVLTSFMCKGRHRQKGADGLYAALARILFHDLSTHAQLRIRSLVLFGVKDCFHPASLCIILQTLQCGLLSWFSAQLG